MIDAGDEVIYPNPGFPIYESMINYVGGKPVPLPIREENGFDFDPAEFERLLSPKTKLVILNSPANPTGGVMAEATMNRVAAALKKSFADVRLIYVPGETHVSEIVSAVKDDSSLARALLSFMQ